MSGDLKNFDETTGQAAWDNLNRAMQQIVRVPRSDIKAKLDAEAATRKRKRTRSAKIKAFREANPKS